MKIKKVEAKEISDSRGNPTVKCRVSLSDGTSGEAAVPSGASVGKYEALELRDGDPKRFGGKGVLKAVENVNDIIAPRLIGLKADEQEKIDQLMIELDGANNKSKLGANAILSVSLSVCRAAAHSLKLPLYQYLGHFFEAKPLLPLPMMNILNGGKHALSGPDFQEFMVVPIKAKNFAESLHIGTEVFYALKRILERKKYPTTLGDEGGFAPPLSSNQQALDLIRESIQEAGFPNRVFLALDPAASEFFQDGEYELKREKKKLTGDQLIKIYEDWVAHYPIVSIEDGLDQDDWEGFAKMTKKLGRKIQIVGDDLYVTNPQRLTKGIKLEATNSILIKPNQIGTLTETIAVMKMAKKAGMTAIVSHRSGETDDPFIADLAVASGCGQIKSGSINRSERVAKYNRLLEIERETGLKLAKFPRCQ